MRLLHVISSVNPHGGGPIEGIKQFAFAHARSGNTVQVASLDDPAAAYVKNFPLPVTALGPGMLKFGYSPRMLPWLKHNAHKYDAVVVNGLWQYHSLAVWRAARREGIPYYVFTHGMLDPWFKREYPLKHLKKWLYWPWGEYRVLRDAQAVLFTSEEERILARQSFWLYSAKERVIRYGTRQPPPDEGGHQVAAFFARFPQLRNKRIALFLGRIHQKKGCDLVIKAFRNVLASDPAWELVMAGPDQVGWAKELRGLATRLGVTKRITWPGMLVGEEKLGALRAAEMFLLPSHQENFGIAVAEAMSCSLPVLISNKVNIWREVEADRAGLVCEDTLEGLCAALSDWIHLSADARERMRNGARASFLSRFEIDSCVSKLTSVLSSERAHT